MKLDVLSIHRDDTVTAGPPDPLRAALWVDTASPAGSRIYGVRSVSASKIASGLAISAEIVVPAGIGRL